MPNTMRADSRNATRVNISSVHGYHEGGYGESYAFAGFESNKYFASDRPILLNENFLRPDGASLKGFGLEIETECWGIRNWRALADILMKVVFTVFPHDLFKLQHDSSLGVCDSNNDEALGVECITQVMTKAFIRNHYKDFYAMYDRYFDEFDFSCSRSGNCGMHVNVSNAVFGDTEEKQIEAIRKLHYFINKNYNFACKLFKRNPDRTYYCEQMYYADARAMGIRGGSHGTCMNYSHFRSGRIEIRLVGGQPDYNAFRNTMECIFFLCDRVRKISWEDLDDMVKVFDGCNQYVAKRLRYCGLDYSVYEAITRNVKPDNFELT